MTLVNSLAYAFSAGRPIRSGRNDGGERAVLYSRGVLMVHYAGSVTLYRTPELEEPLPADEVAEFFIDNYPLPD